MTMEQKSNQVILVGGYDASIAQAIIAANSHCLASPCFVDDGPIHIERPEPITYVLSCAEQARVDTPKHRRVQKRSRSKYSPIEEDRKHSPNRENTTSE